MMALVPSTALVDLGFCSVRVGLLLLFVMDRDRTSWGNVMVHEQNQMAAVNTGSRHWRKPATRYFLAQMDAVLEHDQRHLVLVSRREPFLLS